MGQPPPSTAREVCNVAAVAGGRPAISLTLATRGTISITMSIDSPVVQPADQSAKSHPGTERFASRVVIERVVPEINAGQFPIKRTVGEDVTVEADLHADGHDLLAAVVKYRHLDDPQWQWTAMMPLGNDRFRGQFTVDREGQYEYIVEGWIDRFGSWQRELRKKHEANQDVSSELLEGAEHLREASARAATTDTQQDAQRLRTLADGLRADWPMDDRVAAALSEEASTLVDLHGSRDPVSSHRPLRVVVDPVLARCGAWYEMFPRSASPDPNRPGTLQDVINRLPYVAEMGFDVLYLPPIHPIGKQFRKGPNNSLQAGPHDPGSPWGIGSQQGGHKDIHPELGTLEDFAALVEVARGYGIHIALDIAIQCSPDHPYVQQHPEWFRHRPDGTIKYAENPPKKYQDIYPLNFECEAWQSLWEEIRSVFACWLERGVRVFRVDNPHTKPYAFWHWCLSRLKEQYPDAIFLSEAFTRPKVMKYLAKVGFTQSYTYFTWRNGKTELADYLTELTQEECREYLRPNLFANTPDILHAYLQQGGRAPFMTRFALAATLSASYGIYGPPFELCISQPVREGSEEYLDSEKYQRRHWDLEAPHSLRSFIGQINQIRRENPALQHNWNLKFFDVDNEFLLAYGKSTPDGSNVMMMVVNLDPNWTQSGWLRLPLDELHIAPYESFQVQDLLTGAYYTWSGESNFVMLDPHNCPVHILRLERPIG